MNIARALQSAFTADRLRDLRRLYGVVPFGIRYRLPNPAVSDEALRRERKAAARAARYTLDSFDRLTRWSARLTEQGSITARYIVGEQGPELFTPPER